MRKFYSFGLLMLMSLMFCGIAAVAQTVTVDNIEYTCYFDGTAKLQNGKSATGDVVIPAEVEYDEKKYSVYKIDRYAFENNTAITSVELPASVINIGTCAFSGCKNLTSVKGGAETLEDLETTPFRDTPWVESLPAENGLKYWKGWILEIKLSDAFDECKIKDGTVGIGFNAGSLYGKTLYLPKSFKEINYTNNENYEVEKFVVDKDHPKWFSDDYGNVYNKNGEASYYSYAENKSIDVKGKMLYRVPSESPADTLKVAEGTVALEQYASTCNNYECIIVPEGCEAVLGNNFQYMSRCKYIELPSTLKYLEIYNPNGDNNLEIVLKAKEVPETNNDDYSFYECKHVTLYVPKESLEEYLADPNYNGKFKEIKAIPDDAPLKGDVNGDGKVNAADVTTVYNYIANPEATGLTLDKVDINGDGNINATDITDLYNIIQVE